MVATPSLLLTAAATIGGSSNNNAVLSSLSSTAYPALSNSRNARLPSTTSPALVQQHQQLSAVRRHGIAILAATSVVSLVNPLVTKLRGGAASVAGARPLKLKRNNINNKSRNNKSKDDSNSKAIQQTNNKKQQPTTPSKKTFINLTPQIRSVLCMAIGMSCHYLGYSLARPITVALFTSKSTGYPEFPGAFPFAMAFVSPMSLVLLIMYGHVLNKYGPKHALSTSTIGCAVVVALAAMGIEISQQTNAAIWNIPITKFISGPLFIFRESYVQLLTSQYWSFMASVLDPNQSTKWFAPIAGLTSISSIIGGTGVAILSKRLGLSGTLGCTSVALMISLLATTTAYKIAENNGFNPQPKDYKIKKISKRKLHLEESLLKKAMKLFERVPVLRALFFEILASQGLATLLNICFVASVGETIKDDNVRAGWVGNFYALINVFSMILQFGVLPILMQHIEPKTLWRFTPLISLGFTTFQAIQQYPTLYVISASLLVMKVLEYSARRMLDEMVYVPLDYESRFLGKEIIGVFGYRFGKSLISLSLSGLATIFGQFELQSLSILSDITAFAWAKTAWDLSSLVPTRKEAQDSYEKRTKESNKTKSR